MKHFTNQMAAAGEVDIRKMSRKAIQGYNNTRDIFYTVYRWTEDVYYIKSDDNQITGPYTFQGLELSLESWVPTINELIASNEYAFCNDDLDSLKDVLTAYGYEKNEIEEYLDLHGQDFLDYFNR